MVNQKAKVKAKVIEIWRNMTVKELAESMDKKIGMQIYRSTFFIPTIFNPQITFLTFLCTLTTQSLTQSPTQ